MQKSEQIEVLDKSKEIFGLFQYSPIFVYGLIRLFLAPIYLIYTPGSFPLFDTVAYLIFCDTSSIFQYLIPLQFLFTNTKFAAKLWKKPFLNDTSNQVYIQQQTNEETEEGEGKEKIGDQDVPNGERNVDFSINSSTNVNDGAN
ncbi:unnamed protein product [Caenorhabditis angaria]|uniref:Uncharacterized protein n=1 Tax=Caenorhabditis angaria TaxID=860376 RepID=A0A9P1IN93_9PELO|nr:unnamed protein product [Caenorhabditis angaria]